MSAGKGDPSGSGTYVRERLQLTKEGGEVVGELDVVVFRRQLGLELAGVHDWQSRNERRDLSQNVVVDSSSACKRSEKYQYVYLTINNARDVLDKHDDTVVQHGNGVTLHGQAADLWHGGSAHTTIGALAVTHGHSCRHRRRPPW